MRRVLRMFAAAVLLVALAGCTTVAPEQSPPTTTAPAESGPAVPPPSTGPFNVELHDELMARALELVSECSCTDGCPSCVGPGGENGYGGKQEALAILKYPDFYNFR